MYIDTLFTAFKTHRGARERTRIETVLLLFPLYKVDF